MLAGGFGRAKARRVASLLALLLAWGAAAVQPASPGGEDDVRRFRLERAIPQKLIRRARIDHAKGALNPLRLARVPLMVSTKTCWRHSAACRTLALHPEIVAQARALMAPGARLFLKTAQAVSKGPGACQRLHTDMDMISPLCAGRNSASVWLLAQTPGGEPLPSSPIYAVHGTHDLNTTAEEFQHDRGCWTEKGWTTCSAVARFPAHCSANATVEAAKQQWPAARLQVLEGPRRPMEGIAVRYCYI
jgi:hypothetical protein